MIQPTIGRVVWLFGARQGAMRDVRQPFCAHVTYVWGDRCINVAYFDHDGAVWSERSVDLLQDDDAKPDGVPFAVWMPYQKGQAAKYEAVAGALGVGANAAGLSSNP